MKNLLLSVSVVSLTVSVILLLLPKGKTSKAIKVVACFLVTFMLLRAVISVDLSAVTTEKLFGNGETEYQTGYLDYVREQKKLSIKKSVLAVLEKTGIKISESELNILTVKNSDKFEIEKITVNLSKAVITENAEHINIKETITKTISDALGIAVDAVVVYGN